MIGHLHLEARLQHPTHQRRQQTVVAGQPHAFGAGPAHELGGPVPHRRLITHQRNHRRRRPAGRLDSGETYRQLVEVFFEHTDDVVDATRRFFDGAAELLEATDFDDACPIATIALEVASVNEPMRAAAAGAFDSWIDIIERRLARDGLDPERAHGLAVELFCAMEGAFLLARTTRSSTPLRIVGSSITAGIQRAITHRMKSLSSGAEK